MATRRRTKAEVLVVSSSSSSESDDDAPPAPGPSRHRRTANDQVDGNNQRPNRRTQVPSRSRKSLNRPRGPPPRSPSPDLVVSSPPRRQNNPTRKRRKAWNESSSSEDDEDEDRQRPNRRQPEKRRRQLQISPPPWGSPDFLPVRDRLARDRFDFFDPTSPPNALPRRRGPAYYGRAPSTPVEDRLPPPPPRQAPRYQLDSPPPRPPQNNRRAPAPGRNRRPREEVPELVLADSDDSSDSDDSDDSADESARRPRRRRKTPVETDSNDDEEEDAEDNQEEDVVVVDDEEDDQDAAGNLMDEALAQVLLLFPDILPSHVENLLAAHSDDLGGNYAAAIETVVALLVEDPAYPRVGDDEAEANKKEKDEDEKDWLDVPARLRAREKPDPRYKSHALDLLMGSFRDLSVKLLRTEFARRSHFFAPTFYALTTSNRKGDLATKKIKRPRGAPKKRIAFVAITEFDEQSGEELTRYEAREEAVPELLAQEKRWVEEKIAREDEERLRQQHADELAERERQRAEYLDQQARRQGIAVECQCCFDDIAVENTTTCADGHLFCKTCAAANANTRLGQLQAASQCPRFASVFVPPRPLTFLNLVPPQTLPCMAADCTAVFLPITYSSFLPAVTVDALADLAQQKDLEMAFDGVEGFEKCPFCPFACFIESKMEKLFRCQRPQCRKVSCRQCKLENHIPKTCDEVAKERSLASVHGVEEAMTAALIKNCPKCKVPTCKQDGCNKMTCSNCGVFWCHRCGEQITGYEHFSDENYGGKNPDGCPVFDDTTAREREAIEAARLRAQADLDDHAREAAEKLAEPPLDRVQRDQGAGAAQREQQEQLEERQEREQEQEQEEQQAQREAQREAQRAAQRAAQRVAQRQAQQQAQRQAQRQRQRQAQRQRRREAQQQAQAQAAYVAYVQAQAQAAHQAYVAQQQAEAQAAQEAYVAQQQQQQAAQRADAAQQQAQAAQQAYVAQQQAAQRAYVAQQQAQAQAAQQQAYAAQRQAQAAQQQAYAAQQQAQQQAYAAQRQAQQQAQQQGQQQAQAQAQAQERARVQAQEAATWHAAMANAQNAINNVWAGFAGVWRGW